MKANKYDLKEMRSFPRSWKDPSTGDTWTKAGLELLLVDQEATLGWYTIVDNIPVLGANKQAVKLTLVFTGTSIEQNYTVEDILSPADLVIEARASAKSVREASVLGIKVTITGGKQFDGDEISQSRMVRAIVASDPLETTQWKMADDSIQTVTREELREALRKAGDAQTVIWFT